MSDSQKICFICGGKYKAGGVSIAIMNLLRNNPGFCVDVIAPVEETFDMFSSELKLDKRVNLTCLGETFDKGNRRQFSKALKKYLQHYTYSCGVVHSGLISFQLCCLSALKKSGVTKRIAYSHSKGIHKKNIKKLIQSIFRFRVCKLATGYMAVTEDAGEWLFGEKNLKNVTILPNGINSTRFAFNEQDRRSLRELLNIDSDMFLMGCFGRVSFEKNQEFLLPILKELRNEKIGMLFVGDGLKTDLEQYISDFDIQNVILMDSLKDIEKAYSAIDLLLVPSKFEGLGMVAIEAQCNGLQVICSDGVPNVVDFNLCSFVPLIEEEWTRKIMNNEKLYLFKKRSVHSKTTIQLINNSQFSERKSSLNFWNEIEKTVGKADHCEY